MHRIVLVVIPVPLDTDYNTETFQDIAVNQLYFRNDLSAEQQAGVFPARDMDGKAETAP
jgi:hypothetical protein